MLTTILRHRGHVVLSWVEFGKVPLYTKIPFENKDRSEAKAFEFVTQAAKTCDLFIYYGPAGQDACVELGIAWANYIPIVALEAKGEGLGLMRKCALRWYDDYATLVNTLHLWDGQKEKMKADRLREEATKSS